MTTPTFADHRIAEEVTLARELACQARRCPRRWSVNVDGSLLCTAHAAAPPRDWPGITESLLWKEADAAQRAAAAPAPERRGPLAAAKVRASPEQIAALKARRAAAVELAEQSPRQRMLDHWLALRERERADRRELNSFQADAWRIALKLEPGCDAWEPAWFERPPGEGPRS